MKKNHESSLKYSTTATGDLEEIVSIRLIAAGENAAISLARKIVASLDRLKTFPYLGASCREKIPELAGYRFIICEKYICFYKVQGDTVYIHRILDGRSDYPNHMRGYEKTDVESDS